MTPTIATPGGLQPWRAWLDWFADPMAKAVGELANGLLPLMTPMRGQPQSGNAEPDGYSDLRRRGSYERLLTSEWLLADELPDEFLRRAASGEHLFLSTRPRAQRLNRLLVVLFDAGPWQLGAPRLVHLALWILLARRAELADVELRWGLLQEPGALHAAKTTQDLKLLLAGRSWKCVTCEHRDGWSRWLAENQRGLAECWHVGSPASAGILADIRFSHSVSIVHSVDDYSLEVAMHHFSGRHSVRLRLPHASVASALLRGQFEIDSKPGVVQRSEAEITDRIAPVFSPDGSNVAVALKDLGGVMVFKIPREQEAVKPTRHQWSMNAQAIGIVLNGSHLGAVLRDGETLAFWQIKNLGRAPLPDIDRFSVPPGTAVWRNCFLIYPDRKAYLYVLDAQGRLVYWTADKGDEVRGPHLLERDVLAVTQLNSTTLLYVYREQGELCMRRAVGTVRQAHIHRLGVSAAQPMVLLATGSSGDKPLFTCAVREDVRDSTETWSTHVELVSGTVSGFGVHRYVLPPGERGVGLACDTMADAFGLITLAPNRRNFYRLSPGARETLYASAQPVGRVTVCPNTGDMALLTTDRALIVYSLRSKALRLHVQGSAK